MGPKLAFSLLLAACFTLPAHADTELLQDAWSASSLDSAVNTELSALDARRSAAVAAYNDLGGKLATYDGWCNTYGLTALRNVIEGKLFMKLFSTGGFPAYHIYSNDPYFSGARSAVDKALDAVHTTTFDVGKCLLTEKQAKLLRRDPRQFDAASDDLAGSFPYAVLAGNLRLIDEERAVLLELKGRIAGSGTADNARTVEEFLGGAYHRLQEKINDLRARTLQGYELTFRVPLGPLETYNGKELGFHEGDKAPNFFWIFERRAYYVNQARVAAGKLFEVSVNNFTQADAVGEKLLAVVQEAGARN